MVGRPRKTDRPRPHAAFAARVADILATSGLSRGEAATLAGVTPRTMAAYLEGQRAPGIWAEAFFERLSRRGLVEANAAEKAESQARNLPRRERRKALETKT